MEVQKVTIKAQSLFEGYSDALVIPRSAQGVVAESFKKDIRAKMLVDVGDFEYLKPGEIEVFEYENNRKDNLKPVFHLIYASTFELNYSRLTVIRQIMKRICDFTKKNPDVREIGVPLLGTGTGKLDPWKVYQAMVMVFEKESRKDCKLDVYVPNIALYNYLNEEILNSRKRNHQADSYASELKKNRNKRELLEQDFYIVRSQATEAANSVKYFSRSVWFPERRENMILDLSSLNPGNLLFMTSSQSMSEDFISIIAVGNVIASDNEQLKVDWYRTGFVAMTKNRDFPPVSIFPVTYEYIKKDLLAIENGSAFTNADFIKSQDTLEIDIIRNERVTILNSDVDTGDDYLDISEDVGAFARIIALRSFQPPLAIALCGKWGAGKSFFMNKMIDEIENLTRSEHGNIFCTGIVHIRFNAWSYMDSNLWASIVGRIFNALHNYIKQDEAADGIKNEIRQKIHEELNLTKDGVEHLESERDAIETEMNVLNQKRENIQSELNSELAKVRNQSLQIFIEQANEDFKLTEKINSAIQDNKSIAEVSEFVKKNFPPEIWSNSEWAGKESTSAYAFFIDFFNRKYLFLNIVIFIIILFLIWVLPELSDNLAIFIKSRKFSFRPEFWTVLSFLGLASTRAINSYKKIKPLFVSLWTIRKKYISKIEKVRAVWEQHEKAIALSIKVKEEQIVAIDIQLLEQQSIKSKLIFRLENTINEEALSYFIEKRSNSNDYKQYQGIIATIREDFDILTSLFTGYLADGRETKILSQLERPLERIVLYIDDLDRCSQERIVEVLEAVNLLMAFRLFVVVVGIDPRWVKRALISQKIPKKGKGKEKIASFYLEKIFQIPFHLKPASDTSVKFMIKSLAGSTSGREHFRDNGEIEKEIIKNNEPAPVIDHSLKKNATEQKMYNEQDRTTVTKEIELLVLPENEIELLSDFSILLGSNPRTIKRFVNTYQIVRAHGSVDSSSEDIQHRSEAIMFMLALSIGIFKPLYIDFSGFVKNNGILLDYFEAFQSPKDLDSDKAALKSCLEKTRLISILNIPVEVFRLHFSFVKRFSFEDFL